MQVSYESLTAFFASEEWLCLRAFLTDARAEASMRIVTVEADNAVEVAKCQSAIEIYTELIGDVEGVQSAEDAMKSALRPGKKTEGIKIV